MSNISPRHESQSRHHHRHFRTITVVDSSWLLLKRSARLVVDVLYFSGVSVALAALSTFVISRGDFFLPSSCQRSHASFLQILQVITCVSHAFAVVGVKVVEMRALHQADHPEQRLSALWSLVQLSCHGAPCAFVVALGAIVGATYGVERLSVHKPRINALKLHFYLSCLINAGFRVAVSVAERRIYQQTTLEGRAQQQHHCSSNSSSPPSPPCFVLFLRAYVRVLVPLAIMFLAAGVVHASTYIHLKSHQDTLLFSFAAQALKMAVLALTKRLVLRKSNMSMDESGSAKVVYGITAMPAILIHTQARLILLHTQLSLSVYGIVVFSVLEPALRIARVEWARREVRERLKRNQIVSDSELRRVLPRIAFRSGMLVVSRDRRETPVTFMAEQVDAFLCWKRSLLRFHAAELCADMCSEYIAIGCSTTIHSFFSSVPRFFYWPEMDVSVSGATMQSTGSLEFALLELSLEMVTDLACSLWEIKRGFPLETPSGLRGFLTGIYASCALMTVLISAAMYVNSSANLD